MHNPAFDKHFQEAALERIESVRIKFQKNGKDSPHFSQALRNLEEIERHLPENKKYLAEDVRKSLLAMMDEYDVKIYKLGFLDGLSFSKDLQDE